jgi:hypothetical protein
LHTNNKLGGVSLTIFDISDEAKPRIISHFTTDQNAACDPEKPGQPSDPYLMTGFDAKRIRLAHSAPHAVELRVEIDISGDRPPCLLDAAGADQQLHKL